MVTDLSATPGSGEAGATKAGGSTSLMVGRVVVVVGMDAIVPSPFSDLLGSETPALPVTDPACPDL